MMYYRDEREENPGLRSFCMALYLITGTGGIFQLFNDWTAILIGVGIMFIAWIMVRAQRIAAQGTIYASHVEWTARTISIGSTVLFPLALVISAYIIWHSLDIPALKKGLGDDDLEVSMKALKNFTAANTNKIMHVTDLAMIPPALWWIRRCWFGFMRAKEAIPIDYPDAWF